MGMLTQLSSVKARLGLEAFDTTDDALLTNLIKHVSARFEAECNRVFAAETVQDEAWPARNLSPLSSAFEVFQLCRWPVISMTSITGHAKQVSGHHHRDDHEPGLLSERTLRARKRRSGAS